MSETKNTGGPAFPSEYVLHQRGSVGNEVDILDRSSGMTLRDWFASLAIGNVITSCAGDAYVMATYRTPELYFASKAYAVADAMLEVRAQGGDA